MLLLHNDKVPGEHSAGHVWDPAEAKGMSINMNDVFVRL